MNDSNIQLIAVLAPIILIIVLILPFFSFSKKRDELMYRHIEEKIENIKKMNKKNTKND